MAVREYIGARYVPLFGRKDEETIEWDNTKPYEPLTIVLHQGASYTSRQYVPTGIDIANGEYWALTGNYNAQIEQYRQEVQTFDSRITENTGNIGTLQDQMDATQGSELLTKINANKTAISELDTDVDTRISELETRVDHTVTDAVNTLTNIVRDTTNRAQTMVGGYLAPKYVGDFMADLQFSACCRVADNMYCFAQDSWDGNGTLKIYNLESNSLVDTKTILMGHANSVAYDLVRNCFWLAPMNTYSAGAATPVNYIYRYNPNFNVREQVTIEGNTSLIYGVSFDAAKNNMYAFVAQDYYEGPIFVYRMSAEESAFTLYKTIPALDAFDCFANQVWQDFAVWDDMLFAARPEGTVYCIDLAEDEMKVSYTFRIGNRDTGNIWEFGEVEGLEFDAQGRLYNARNAMLGINNANAHHNVNCCFVTELNTANNIETADSTKQTVYGTLDVSDEFNTKFALARNEIRSINQLYWRTQACATVQVKAGKTYTDENTRLLLENPITLAILGTCSLNTINLSAGHLFLYVADTGTLTFTNQYQGIGMSNQAAMLYFRNNGTINLPNASRMVNTGYAPAIMCIGSLGTLTGTNAHKFQDTTVSSAGMLMGNTRVVGTN